MHHLKITRPCQENKEIILKTTKRPQNALNQKHHVDLCIPSGFLFLNLSTYKKFMFLPITRQKI
jgi:hypothetical protein